MVEPKQMVEKSAKFRVNDNSGIQDERVQSIETSFVKEMVVKKFVEEMVVENPSSLSVTHEDVEAIQAFESTNVSHASVKDNTDYNFSGIRVFPNVSFENGSSQEKQSEEFVLLFFKMLVMMFPGLGSFLMYQVRIRQVRKI